MQISRFVQNIDALFLDYAKLHFDAVDKKIWPTLASVAANLDVKKFTVLDER